MGVYKVMTNISMYVYEQLADYVQLYPKGQDKIVEDHMCAFWINGKNVVIINNNKKGVAGYRPDFSKSIVYFDGGEEGFKKYEDNFEPVVEIKRDRKSITFSGQEVPYSVAVEIEKFEQEGNLRRIFAVIIVDHESLKPMIIGNKGERLKEISKSARLDMEKLFGGKVWLETWVKVKTGWADDVRALKSLGL